MVVVGYRCGQLVEKYLQDDSPEARLLVGGDMRKIQLCFSLLKVHVQCTQTYSHSSTAGENTNTTHSCCHTLQ